MISFRRRSFVRRGGRGTAGQVRAQDLLGPQVGLMVDAGELEVSSAFGRLAPTYLEIGFGTGQSLLAAAKAYPDKNFIGVETHQPGIGALYMGMQAQEVMNIRVYDADVVDVLAKCIPPDSLAGVMIFFPDPWQKRRHHPRRLVQVDFLNQLAAKIQQGGVLHLATDWQDYADHMLAVVSSASTLRNIAGDGQWGRRSPYRPVVSKFEQRALCEGRKISELQLEKR